ncbi:MAG: histidinol dehydrogenase [Anaerosomatales bacterium]|nr:histidinol dehydrogenase [Anaerosomatales bacterium]
MLRRITLDRGERLTEADLSRSGGLDAEVLGVAARIIDEVRTRGDEALREYTLSLDKAEIGEFRVTPAEIEAAVASVEPAFLDAIATAAGAIADFHQRQVTQSWFTAQEGGIVLGQRVTPISRVGIYVPGGRACYPSSVLMNAIPAQVAGVDEIAMVVPPASDGSVNPYTLAAAAEVGIDEIYKAGGAQAVAALAYGTGSVDPVDKIVGPGNAYVTAAKKLVMGEVGIDALAGPSEVCVLADTTAVPAFVAIDLMAQAEHDPRAATYVVTIDPDLPDDVEEALGLLLADAPRADIIRRSLADNGLIVVCPDIVAALDTVDLIAPEHLEIQMADPFDILGSVRNAGAIFLGHFTPESIGDYVAGPNHVLPTGGTARFSSPLSVDDFVKKSSVISYSFEALELDGPTAITIAEAEGLDAHARAVSLRLQAMTEQLEDE